MSARDYVDGSKPLAGSCYCSDEHFHKGRAVIARMESAPDRPLELEDCADALHFVHNAEPLADGYDDEQRLGRTNVLERIEDAIRAHVKAVAR